MLMVVIRVSAIPEKRREFLQTLRLLADETRRSAGCLSHEWYQSAEQPDVMILLEQWESREHLRRHQRSESFRVFAGAVRTLAEGFEMQTFNVRNVSGGPRLCPGNDGHIAV